MKRKNMLQFDFFKSNLFLAFFPVLFLKGDDGALACLGCGGFGLVFVLILIAFILFPLVCQWKIFVKAGKPGWAVLVPIYNVIILTEIVGRETLWVVLALIPGVNIVIFLILLFDLAKSFGKEPGFGLGMLLLPFIFYPILAFGDAKYVGPAAAQKPSAPGM